MPSASAPEPTEDLKQKILYEAEKHYMEVRCEIPEDFDQYSHYERCLRKLDMTSSPGIPYCREATTNGQWLKWDGMNMSLIQKQRLWHDVQEVFTGNYDMLIRTFIKLEPHKKSKCEEKRWRLIMAAPLPVQVAWQMLFSMLNDKEIERSYVIPSQQGLVMVNGGWKRYLEQWTSQGLQGSLDKSAWDWTAPYWMLFLDLQLRHRLMYGQRREHWYSGGR